MRRIRCRRGRSVETILLCGFAIGLYLGLSWGILTMPSQGRDSETTAVEHRTFRPQGTQDSRVTRATQGSQISRDSQGLQSSGDSQGSRSSRDSQSLQDSRGSRGSEGSQALRPSQNACKNGAKCALYTDGSPQHIAQQLLASLDTAFTQGPEFVKDVIGEGNDEYLRNISSFLEAHPVAEVKTVVRDAMWQDAGKLMVFSVQEKLRFRDGKVVPEQRQQCSLWTLNKSEWRVHAVEPCP